MLVMRAHQTREHANTQARNQVEQLSTQARKAREHGSAPSTRFSKFIQRVTKAQHHLMGLSSEFLNDKSMITG